MPFAAYINVEPTTGVACRLVIDDGTTIAGTGQQHVEFHGIPDAVNGWGGYVEASAPGYQDARVRVQVVAPALLNPKPPEGDGGYVFVRLEKGSASQVHIEGREFKTSDGKPWLWKMCDFYRGVAHLRDDGEAWFRSSLRQKRDAGFNGVRIYASMHYLAHIHPKDAGTYDLIQKADDILADERMIPEWTNGDMQVTLPTEADQDAHHGVMLDICRTHRRFYDWCNEAFKNGGHVQCIQRANRSGVTCTYGHPYLPPEPSGKTPALDYHAHATTRDLPKAYADAAKMFWYGEGINDQGQRFDQPRPIIDQEGIGAASFVSDRRSNDPNLFWHMGAGSKAYGNGMTFHDDSFGSNWDGVITQCALACIDGLNR